MVIWTWLMPKCKKQCNERFVSLLQLRFDKYMKRLPARVARFSFHLDVSLAEESDLCTRWTKSFYIVIVPVIALVVVIVHQDIVAVRIVGCISPGDSLRTVIIAVHIKGNSVATCPVVPICDAYNFACGSEKGKLLGKGYRAPPSGILPNKIFNFLFYEKQD